MRTDWNGVLALSIFHSNNNAECRGGVNHPQGKLASVPLVLTKYHNIEYMLDNNQERYSVAKTSYPSDENSTTLTPSARATR